MSRVDLRIVVTEIISDLECKTRASFMSSFCRSLCVYEVVDYFLFLENVSGFS